MPEDDEREFIWRVTNIEEGGIDVAFGPKLSEAPFSDDDKLHILGKALIGLGTRLMGSTTNDDDFDDDWEDED